MTVNKTDTNVIYFSRLHWIIFVTPVVFFLLSCGLWFISPNLYIMATILNCCFLLWIGMTWVTYYFSSLTIQKKQVILRTGVLVRQTVDIPLAKIETMDIRQSIIGSMFHYGTLIITGTGGTRHFVNFLNKPLTCRRYIEQLMNEH